MNNGRRKSRAGVNTRVNIRASMCALWWNALWVLVAGLAFVGPAAWAAEKAPSAGHAAAKPAEPATGKAAPAKKGNALEHVLDEKEHWHFFDSLPHVPLPRIFGFQITKFMILELIAAVLVIAIYVPMARRLRNGELPHGWRDNTFEVLLTFIRDEVAKPSIGEHDADRFVPFLWTMFLFILFCNLLGILPFAGSPTASIYVTGALAVCVFFSIHGSAIGKMGFIHYVQSLWPHIDVPFGLGYILKPLVFLIEIVGVLVRNAVLAVRLFANMFAGHMVLATILLFIVATANMAFGLWASITFASILGIIALSLLEIFVAFLQAYIFVFLTALFMGMAMHPQH
jgi:F-type H+-transporting ATPase subunit a